MLLRGQAEAAAAAKDAELRHLADQLSDANSLRRTCDNLRRELQDTEDDYRIATEAAARCGDVAWLQV